MAITKSSERYVVVVYCQSTDIQSIAYLAEYLSAVDAEKDIEGALHSGALPENIRVFKATECTVYTKEVAIND